MSRKALITFVLLLLGGAEACGQNSIASTASTIDGYVERYVESGNFSGVVLVEQGKQVVFENSYGFADRERGIRNRLGTRFHIASMSMQFTAAAILRLTDQGMIRLDDHVGQYLPGIEGADTITIRDLLVERSGLPDINALPDYNDVLQQHQTPASLVAKIQGRSLLFEPGTKFLHEEHSAYNVLALIIEKKSGLAFSEAMRHLVFEPLRLKQSGIDDDSKTAAENAAKGYQPKGTFEVEPGPSIHWSGKAGNASVITTADDERIWVDALFSGTAMSARSLEAVLESSPRVGYGWFRGSSGRFGENTYSMNGRAPGFASYVLHLPARQTTVVVLSNIYSSAVTTMGDDIAAIALGMAYEPVHLSRYRPTAQELRDSVGSFRFGADFYQPGAVVSSVAENGQLLLRWPSDGTSPLIPLAKDQFIDRSYWEKVRIERDEKGKPSALIYGTFRGVAARVD